MAKVRIDILNYKELIGMLNDLPTEVADIAIGDVQEYLVNVMKSDQPPKSTLANMVPRAVAYPDAWAISPYGKKIQGFFSWRQFKLVCAKWNNGEIPYHRTQAMSKGWHIVKRGLFGYVVNRTPGVQYVVGERKQSRHEQLVGWLKPSQQIAKRRDKIKKIIDGSVKKAKKKLGLK